MNELNNKIAFITGASSGIGEAITRKFSEAGARLILAARRIDRLQRLAAELKTDTHLIQLDVRNQPDVEKAVNDLPQNWQAVDILVNNAGLSRGLDKLYEGRLSDWEEMIDTNVKGLLYVSRAVIPGMVQRDRGHVINIGSIAGHQVYPAGNVYCATKHAVNAITQGMLLDLADTAVKVSTIDPGLAETEFSKVRFHGDSERADKVYRGFKPLRGEDIADAVFWVVSRPDHVQIAEMIIFPTAQRSATTVRKE